VPGQEGVDYFGLGRQETAVNLGLSKQGQEYPVGEGPNYEHSEIRLKILLPGRGVQRRLVKFLRILLYHAAGTE